MANSKRGGRGKKPARLPIAAHPAAERTAPARAASPRWPARLPAIVSAVLVLPLIYFCLKFGLDSGLYATATIAEGAARRDRLAFALLSGSAILAAVLAILFWVIGVRRRSPGWRWAWAALAVLAGASAPITWWALGWL